MDKEIPKAVPFDHNAFFDSTGAVSPDSWRVMRIMAEAVEAFDTMNDLDRMMVSVFGSARTPESSPEYQSAFQCGALLAKQGYGIITGGGPGIMEAACRGAYEAGGVTVGLNIRLPHEQNPNPYQKHSLYFRYFFLRKMTFLKYAAAVIVYPGGYGTIDEFSEVLTMAQTEKINLIPIIFVGKKFWKGFADWVRNSLLGGGMIDQDDLNLFKVVDSAEEAVEFLVSCHRYGRYGTELR